MSIYGDGTTALDAVAKTDFTPTGDRNFGIQSAISDAWAMPADYKRSDSTSASKPESKISTDDSDNKAKAEDRKTVVDLTIEALKSGKFEKGSDEAKTVAAAIGHQLEAGGAKAADSLAADITKGLPNGMKLEIKEDAEFEKKVKDAAAAKKEPAPEYVRKVELKDKDGKVIGSFNLSATRKPIET